MRRLLALCLLAALPALSAPPAAAQAMSSERFFQERFCAGLEARPRPDDARETECRSTTHALAVDFHDRWRDAVGQALAQAADRELAPGVVLVCRSDEALCRRASAGVREVMAAFGVAFALWECLPIHATLSQCTRRSCDAQGHCE